MRKLLLTLAALAGLAGPARAADDTSLGFGGMVYQFQGEGSLNSSTFALDATTDAYGCVFCMPEAATITKACTHLGFKTGTPPTYKISVQGVDGSGYNDGTPLGGGSPASATFTVGSDGAFQCVTLDNSIALTRGQCVAMNVEYSSGTINGTNYEEYIYGMVSNGSGPRSVLPYCYTNTAGTKAKTSTRIPSFALQSASKTYGMPARDNNAITVTAYSSNSSPDEYAIRFLKPADTCSTFTVKEVVCLGKMPNTGKTLDIKLYSGTTALQTISGLDSDFTDHTTASSERWPMRFTFTDASLTALTCGTAYRIGIVPNETSSSVALATLTVSANSDLTAYPGGIQWYLSTRTDAGAWTDVTTKRPLCYIVTDDVTVPAGGSETFTGQSINRGLN